MYSRCAASSSALGAKTRIAAAGDGIVRRREVRSVERGRSRGHVDRERFLAARHREIHLGQELGVEQRAVHRPMRIVDTEALAERVQAVALAGKHLAGEREGVDHAGVDVRARRKRDARELGVEKPDVERSVVDDPFRARREGDEFRGDLLESRLALEIVPGHPVHFGRANVDLAFGVEAKMDRPAGRAAIGDFESGDLDDPVPELRVEAGGLGIDDDLAHAVVPTRDARRPDPRGRGGANRRMIRRSRETLEPRADSAGSSSGSRRSRARSRPRRDRARCLCGPGSESVESIWVANSPSGSAFR